MGEFDLDDFYVGSGTARRELPMAPDLYDVRVYAEGGALDGVIRVFAENQDDAYLKLGAMALSDVHELVGRTPTGDRGLVRVIGVDRRRRLRSADRPPQQRL